MKDVADKKLTEEQLWLYQALSERSDIIQSKYDQLVPDNAPNYFMTAGSGISMIKLREGSTTELYLGHSAYESYTALMRVGKRVRYIVPSSLFNENENIDNDKEKGKEIIISFTSSPGCIASTDEFYVKDNRLGIASVRMHSFKYDEYKTTVTSDGVMGWMRSLASNLISTTGKEWAENSVKNSTHTDTKNTVIVDYKRFKPSGDKPKDKMRSETVLLVESYPLPITEEEKGYSITDISSDVADNRYVMIQNAPYTEKTYKALGYEIVDVSNILRFYLSRNESSRVLEAKNNLKKNSGNLKDVEDYVRSNSYKNNEFDIHPDLNISDPCAALGCHCELRDDNQSRINNMAYGIIGSNVVDRYSIRKKNYVLAAGAAPVDDVGTLSIDDLNNKAEFSHQGIPGTIMNLDYCMMAMDGENQKVIKIIMLILLILSSLAAVTGIVAAIVVFSIRYYKKRKAVKDGLSLLIYYG